MNAEVITKQVQRALWEVRFYLSNIDPTKLPAIDFRKENLRRLPPSTSAVYFILNLDDGKILYIGKAHDLKWRFQTNWPHRCLAQVGQYGQDIALAWWKLPKPTITAVESILIHLFQPPLNKRERYQEKDYEALFREHIAWEPEDFVKNRVTASRCRHKSR